MINRILLVEDNDALRELMQEMLQNAGYATDSARHGAEALALNFVAPADLVITDLFMPKMGGLETIIELRKQNPNLHFIAISGRGKEGLSFAKKFGAEATLAKPFSSEKLLETVSAIVRHSRRFLRPSLA